MVNVLVQIFIIFTMHHFPLKLGPICVRRYTEALFQSKYLRIEGRDVNVQLLQCLCAAAEEAASDTYHVGIAGVCSAALFDPTLRAMEGKNLV